MERKNQKQQRNIIQQVIQYVSQKVIKETKVRAEIKRIHFQNKDRQVRLAKDMNKITRTKKQK